MKGLTKNQLIPLVVHMTLIWLFRVIAAASSNCTLEEEPEESEEDGMSKLQLEFVKQAAEMQRLCNIHTLQENVYDTDEVILRRKYNQKVVEVKRLQQKMQEKVLESEMSKLQTEVNKQVAEMTLLKSELQKRREEYDAIHTLSDTICKEIMLVLRSIELDRKNDLINLALSRVNIAQNGGQTQNPSSNSHTYYVAIPASTRKDLIAFYTPRTERIDANLNPSITGKCSILAGSCAPLSAIVYSLEVYVLMLFTCIFILITILLFIGWVIKRKREIIL